MTVRGTPGNCQPATILRNFSATPGVARIRLSEQDAELLASVAAYHVDLPQLLVKQRRNLAQHLVAQHMSKLVIEPLELIDVGHDDGHTGAVTAGTLDLFREYAIRKSAG